MTDDVSAIRQRLAKLQALAECAGTPQERAAALAAIERLQARLPLDMAPLRGLLLSIADMGLTRCRCSSKRAMIGAEGIAHCANCNRHLGRLSRAKTEALLRRGQM